MNNKSLKMILHSLNNKKYINFLRIFAEYVNNKDEKLMFIFKTLNV